MSTGCKTLLNIISNPEKCFDVIECWQNALQKVIQFTSGNILWENPVILIYEPTICDIVINDKSFTNTMSLAEYVTNLMLGEYDE